MISVDSFWKRKLVPSPVFSRQWVPRETYRPTIRDLYSGAPSSRYIKRVITKMRSFIPLRQPNNETFSKTERKNLRSNEGHNGRAHHYIRTLLDKSKGKKLLFGSKWILRFFKSLSTILFTSQPPYIYIYIHILFFLFFSLTIKLDTEYFDVI